MSRSRLKIGRACNYAKEHGIDPKDVYSVFVRNHNISIVSKKEGRPFYNIFKRQIRHA